MIIDNINYNNYSNAFQKSVILHEIGHAIGFYHEQTRPDRDNYVTIHLDNVKPASRFNFNKYPSDYINVYDVPYDYRSIMHYGQKVGYSTRLSIIVTLF